MEPAKVYFSDLRTDEVSTLEKLHRLMKAAGFEQIDFKDKYVAIKLHFGEPGNMAYLRPNWARVVCDYVRELGGKPFLTDCNTLYVGGRANALDHLDSAMRNGYTPMTTGAQCIIADGLKGDDYDLVPIRGGKYLRAAKIGRAIMDADVFISLTHFKGHEATGFGGTIKNIGMGCGSRAGKTEQHSNGIPTISSRKCVGCKRCQKECANGGLVFNAETKKMTVDTEHCVGCSRCLGACNFDAITFRNSNANAILNCKMAEYTKAVIDGRPNFHISLVIDVSPNCDCHGENDVPILPNIGMFASFDPLALDQACVDACLKAEPMPNSQLSDNMSRPDFVDHHDHFTNSTPESEWQSCLEHADKIGLGSRDYELIVC